MVTHLRENGFLHLLAPQSLFLIPDPATQKVAGFFSPFYNLSQKQTRAIEADDQILFTMDRISKTSLFRPHGRTDHFAFDFCNSESGRARKYERLNRREEI